MRTDARNFLGPDDLAAIRQAVADAERRTAAEIACAVATESGRYDRAESLWGLAGSLAGLGLVHAAWSGFVQGPGSWAPAGGAGLAAQALAVAAGFAAGTALAAYGFLPRAWLVGAREAEEEVAAAAARVFETMRVRGTAGRTGLLLYVSIRERRAVLLADERAREALGAEGLAALRDEAVGHLRAGRRREAFTSVVARAADRLAVALPADGLNPDELAPGVRIFHPRP